MKIELALLVSFSTFFARAGGTANNASVVADNPLNHISTTSQVNPELYAQQIADQQAYAQSLEAAEQAKKAAIQLHETEMHESLDTLKKTLQDDTRDAALAEQYIQIARQAFFDAKKHIPKDPWREISGHKVYVLSSDSNFVRFDGQILEKTPEGIRVMGSFGRHVKTEFFVSNFPYNLVEGSFIGTNPIFAAVQDGNLSYITTDGFAKSIDKLEYGKPCTRPGNASVIELKAMQLTREEDLQIENAKQTAEAKKKDVQADKLALEKYEKKIEEYEADKQKTENAPLERALKFNQEQADRGEPTGLLRMGQRYRDGEGVPKNLIKAHEYFTKAINAGSRTAARELSKLNSDTQNNSH